MILDIFISTEEELNKLDEKMKAITKLCLLPEQTFFCVLKFCRL